MKIFFILLFLTNYFLSKTIMDNTKFVDQMSERRLQDFDEMDIGDRFKIEKLKQRLDSLIEKVRNLNDSMETDFEKIEISTLKKMDMLKDDFKDFQKDRIGRELNINFKDIIESDDSGDLNHLNEKVAHLMDQQTEEKRLLKLESKKKERLDKEEKLQEIKTEMKGKNDVLKKKMEEDYKNLHLSIEREISENKKKFEEEEIIRQKEQDDYKNKQEEKILLLEKKLGENSENIPKNQTKDKEENLSLNDVGNEVNDKERKELKKDLKDGKKIILR